MLVYIFAVLLLVAAVILLIDLVPMAKDWLSRIHIGRYKNASGWEQSITKAGLKWLNHTPKIKVTDNTRFVAIDMMRGNYTRQAIQHWQEASLLLGLNESLKRTGDKRTENEIRLFLSSKLDDSGQWLAKPEHVDAAILSYAIMKLECIDAEKYSPALDYTWELIQSHIGEDGTVLYRKSMRNYRYVDTIGFICPFLVAYGIRFQKEACIKLAVKQIMDYEQYGMLDKHYLPSHAYSLKNTAPLGLYGWGRGLGWFSLGLIDAWRELPQEHSYKPLLEDVVKRFARTVITFQEEEGHWNWTVTRSETRADSSTTAALGWYLVQAAQIDELHEECMASAEKAIRYLMKVTRRSGAVDFSQGDTKDIGVYSMLFNILPFTQGLCIRMVNAYSDAKAV